MLNRVNTEALDALRADLQAGRDGIEAGLDEPLHMQAILDALHKESDD